MDTLRISLLLKAVFIIVLLMTYMGCVQDKDNASDAQVEIASVVSKVRTSDEDEILKTINNFYKNIAIDSNNMPDFKTIKEQFVDRARLGYIRKDSLIIKSPVDYFDQMEQMMARNKPKYLKEWEIKGETKLFGDIAQRTSVYGVQFNTTDSLSEKGVINFQLVKLHGHWKILSMIWKSEKNGVVIPENYLD